MLDRYGARYHGWLPNHAAPEVFARHAFTVHVPRRFYVTQLPGIPTIRVFEALACGIPLISAPWDDAEGLFTPGEDFLVAEDGAAVAHHARRCWTSRISRAPSRSTGWPRSAPATAARTGSTSLLAIVAPAEARMTRKTLAFYGSSLLSSYWNGAATYYRGILSALHPLGWDITFYEPDAFDRQSHRDIEPPDYATLRRLPGDRGGAGRRAGRGAQGRRGGEGQRRRRVRRRADRRHRRPCPARRAPVFWDVDAPATLAAITPDPACPLRQALPQLDMVLTYGGGPPVIAAYTALGARACTPVYNALDPATHHPVPPDPRFAADLGFLANRLPDREARVEAFFLDPPHSCRAAASCSAASAGTTSRCRPTSAASATPPPRTTTPSTAPRWPC